MILAAVFGTPWTPSLAQLSESAQSSTQIREPAVSSSTALETGGTDSGKIRLIVWKGALAAWRAKPILGHGVETFAILYPRYRPVEHNLVSEWEFIYNKAHNEYLNYLSTTGLVGLVSYITLTVFSVFSIVNSKHEARKPKQLPKTKIFNFSRIGIFNLFRDSTFEIRILKIAFLSGYASILVTNFFGFSVVPTSLLLFLFPAMAITADTKQKAINEREIALSQKILLLPLLIVSCHLLFSDYRYWKTDVIYNTARKLYSAGEYERSREILEEVVLQSPKQTDYWDQLALTSSRLAVEFHEDGDDTKAKELGGSAIFESSKALGLSPHSIPVMKNAANIFIRLSALDSNHLVRAREMMREATHISPTDPKLHYNLG